MAPPTWALAVLGLTTLVSGLALPVPQNGLSDMTPDEAVAYWCPKPNPDLSDPEVVHKLWTYGRVETPGQIVSVGTQLASWAENMDVKNHRWADAIMDLVKPNAGDNGLGGCGVPGGECNPDVDCSTLARLGYGNLYWALRALVGMHSKLNIAHEKLQDTAILDILSLSEIAKDFTAPAPVNSLDTLASLLGVSLYFIGGAAGMGGVAAGGLATRAATQSSRAGVLQGARRVADKNIQDQATKAATLAKLDTAIANAEKIAAANAQSAGKALGTLGASTYFIGGTFGVIGIGQGPTYGQITGDDLDTDFRNLFIQASTWLNQTGLLAAGHASADADYSMLPGTKDDALYFDDNAIANFYSNGKFLLSEADPTFRNSVQGAYESMKPRIVDMALQKANWKILAETGWENTQTGNPEQACLDAYGFGTRFIDGLCVNLWQDIPDGETCEGGTDRCYNRKMSEDQHKALTDKYKFDIWDYYAAGMDCGKAKGKPGEPDIDTLPENGDTPLCWFGVYTQKGAFERTGGADEPGDQYWKESGW